MIFLEEKYKNILNNVKFIDLFSGIGGFRIALESFGAKCIFSSEIDKHAINVYKNNFNDLPLGDIKTIKEKNIPTHDILCAGFPCQSFSISGKQKGFDDTRGTLFFDIIRIMKEKKPKMIFLENVKNLVSHNNGETFKLMLKELKELKYNIFYKIINSSDYGLAQSRKRVYIIGFNKNIKFKFPNGYNDNIILDNILEKEVNEKYFLKRDDIHLNLNKINNINLSNKTPLKIGQVGRGGQGERIYYSKGKSITLSAEGGGPGSKTGLYYINQKIRKLTPRECARLQGFPDSFQLSLSDNQGWKQFGNSVSINVLQSIIKEVIDIGYFNEGENKINE